MTIFAWLSALPLPWIFVIGILSFAGIPTGVLGAMNLWSRLKVKFSGRSGKTYWGWRNKHNDVIAPQRKGFYNVLDEAYRVWSRGSNAPADFYDLLRDTEFPPRIPVGNGDNLLDAAIEESLSESGKHLLSFVESIYPSSRHEMTKLISADQYEEFDNARRVLSKFWNDTGQSFFDFKELTDQDIRTAFPAHAREVRLLTYLEYALHNRLRAEGGGKHWMFRLYKWAKEHDRAP